MKSGFTRAGEHRRLPHFSSKKVCSPVTFLFSENNSSIYLKKTVDFERVGKWEEKTLKLGSRHGRSGEQPSLFPKPDCGERRGSLPSSSISRAGVLNPISHIYFLLSR